MEIKHTRFPQGLLAIIYINWEISYSWKDYVHILHEDHVHNDQLLCTLTAPINIPLYRGIKRDYLWHMQGNIYERAEVGSTTIPISAGRC